MYHQTIIAFFIFVLSKKIFNLSEPVIHTFPSSQIQVLSYLAIQS